VQLRRITTVMEESEEGGFSVSAASRWWQTRMKMRLCGLKCKEFGTIRSLQHGIVRSIGDAFKIVSSSSESEVK
jgi:hypothetical protein